MSFRLAKCAVISLAIGLIVALLVVSGMKSKLKSVRAQRGATQYTRPDSLIITREREIYLYSTVTRVKREKSSSSSGSSGEMSHSGSSRKL